MSIKNNLKLIRECLGPKCSLDAKLMFCEKCESKFPQEVKSGLSIQDELLKLIKAELEDPCGGLMYLSQINETMTNYQKKKLKYYEQQLEEFDEP